MTVLLPLYSVGIDEQNASEASVMELVLSNLNALLCAIISMDCTLASLTAILTKLEFYIVSKKPLERERACSSYLILLKKFVSLLVSEKPKLQEKERPPVRPPASGNAAVPISPQVTTWRLCCLDARTRAWPFARAPSRTCRRCCT